MRCVAIGGVGRTSGIDFMIITVVHWTVFE
jgi:hypothetical protein